MWRPLKPGDFVRLRAIALNDGRHELKGQVLEVVVGENEVRCVRLSCSYRWWASIRFERVTKEEAILEALAF